MLTKGLFLKKMAEFLQTHSEYTIGECLYSMLHRGVLRDVPKDVNLSWLLTVDDRDLYGAIERAIEEEKVN